MTIKLLKRACHFAVHLIVEVNHHLPVTVVVSRVQNLDPDHDRDTVDPVLNPVQVVPQHLDPDPLQFRVDTDRPVFSIEEE